MASLSSLQCALVGVFLVGLGACAPGDVQGPEHPGAGDDQPDASVPALPLLDAGASCAPTLASIQANLFVPQCALAGCHTGAHAAAALDLTRTDLSALLVNKSAASCAGQLLVAPGNPSGSLLLGKMNGHLPAGCGDSMPPSGAPIASAQLACVEGWIMGLTSVTADAGADASGSDASACQSCGGQSCLDLTSDPLHCGSCSIACAAGSSCKAGVCQCPSGLTSCNGSCVDLRSDRTHCGSCQTQCGAGATCTQGACACAASLTNCSGTCVELASDANNCQGCGVKCASNQLCTPSGCSTSASCGSLTKCGSACVDTATSLSNCGGCGLACAAGQTCQAGHCTCPNGGMLCGGSCIDTKSNALNCGSCGNVCPSGTTCSSGSCTCDGGKTLCGGTCVDTTGSPDSCGSCGNVCGAGKACVKGVCSCAGGPVSFSQVAPILVDNCTNSGCHVGVMPKEGLNLTAAKAYSELVNVKASQCSDGRLLVPTTGTGKSYLLQKLYGQSMCSGSQMPKAGVSLASSELALIEAWVCNGAQP